MNKENITIRDPKKTDIDQVLKYINTLSKEKTYILFQGLVMSKKAEYAWLKDNMEKIKKGKAVVKFIFYKNEFIGSGVINMRSEKTAKEHLGVFGISIAKKYRGKGYGSMLMDEVLNEAKKHFDKTKDTIVQMADYNHKAINFYTKLGFTDTGKRWSDEKLKMKSGAVIPEMEMIIKSK